MTRVPAHHTYTSKYLSLFVFTACLSWTCYGFHRCFADKIFQRQRFTDKMTTSRQYRQVHSPDKLSVKCLVGKMFCQQNVSSANLLSAKCAVTHSGSQVTGFSSRQPASLTQHSVPVSHLTWARYLLITHLNVLHVQLIRQPITPSRSTLLAKHHRLKIFLLEWNSLPDYLRDTAVGRDTFRQYLKTFVFASYECIQNIRGFTFMCYE